jgi:predicted lactoylglutathione lyase
MARQIFVNLPVRDLERSKAFFSRLGFGFNAQFTDDNAACMIVEGARKSTEVLVCLSCGSQDEVDGLVAKASAGGGKPVREPQDHGQP